MGSFGVSLPVVALNNAFLGDVTRIGGNLVITARPILSTSANGAKFGDPLVIVPGAAGTGDTYESVADFITGGGTFTAARFAGVAKREVKTQTTFTAMLTIPPAPIGLYAPGEMAEGIEQGSCAVLITSGAAPVSQGPVFIRTVFNATFPNSPVGSFTSAADGTNTVQLTGVVFRTGVVDANNIAEITMLSRVAA